MQFVLYIELYILWRSIIKSNIFLHENRYLISDMRYQISVKYAQVNKSIKDKVVIDSSFTIF